ncbi:iron ABC transporter permease [Macrococcus brunensis]|uniref:Iron ABC transporter permease n=1 Tax=Macrococcus brunensis TaxID=198483 RepID=A0A4R6BBN8_9STAP|nr:iron ABC transporter permease [Macrococcus brunensis]TDL95226.1 iron ABC transporter permease [Macrococcus brunensis]
MKLIYSALSLFLVTLMALCLGDSWLNPVQAVTGLFGTSDAYTNLVVQTIRLPRILLTIAAGAAFGMTGCLLQTLTRNPLASPDVIGLSQMANVGALMFLVLFTSTGGALLFPIHYQPAPAICCALLAGFVLYLFSFYKRVSIHRFILIGIGINALAQSMVTLLILLTNKRAAQAHVFITGSVQNAEYYQVLVLGVILVVLTGFILYYHRYYDIYKLGRATSIGLGAKYQKIAVLTLVSLGHK